MKSCFAIARSTMSSLEKMNAASTSHLRLVGKVAIITGGASGIGASAVKLFHEHGAKVVIADIQDSLGLALSKRLGDGTCFVHCDVTKEDDVRDLVDTAVSKYGKLDIMFNNAGVLGRVAGGILDCAKSDLEILVGVNLVGAFLGAKHAARVMVPRKQGCILFTASACTAIGGLGTPEYAMTKHGIVGLAKNLVWELGQHGIRVNTISPSGVATPMSLTPRFPEVAYPLAQKTIGSAMGVLNGQVLEPEGVALAALYLVSDEANYVSGLNMVVDGGFSSVNPTLLEASGSPIDHKFIRQILLTMALFLWKKLSQSLA